MLKIWKGAFYVFSLMLKKIFLIVLCTLSGAVFIFSGYTKLYPIEPFEYTFVDIGFINWQMAPFIARLMIGAEFCIGILLALNITLRKITFKLGIGILLFFCVYLLLLILIVGNKGNCGCFGTYIQMTPLQALIKNVVMLFGFMVLYKTHEGWEINKRFRVVIPLICIGSFVMPFVLNPVELNYSEAYLNKPENNYKIQLDTLYINAEKNNVPKTLSQGKHIIVFLSSTCPHCRIAAKKIRIISERNPEIPFYFIINSGDENLKLFFEDTHTDKIPYSLLKGKPFVYLAGTSVPRIYMINNGIVENEVNYFTLDQNELERWLLK